MYKKRETRMKEKREKKIEHNRFNNIVIKLSK